MGLAPRAGGDRPSPQAPHSQAFTFAGFFQPDPASGCSAVCAGEGVLAGWTLPPPWPGTQFLVSAPLCPACHPTASLRVPEMGGGLVYFCRNRWVPVTQAPILVPCLQSLVLAYDEYLVGEEQQEGTESFAPSSF